MEKRNARGIGAQAQYELRLQIVKMLEEGKTGLEISRELGISRGHVSNVKKLWQEHGMDALKIKSRGNYEGKGRILSSAQCRKLLNILIVHKPEQYFEGQYLWNKKLLVELAKQEFDVELQGSAMNKYLKYWGMDAVNPNHYTMKHETVEEWLQRQHPELTDDVGQEDVVVLFAHQKNVRITARMMYTMEELHADRTLSDICIRGKMLSAVTKRGVIFFTFFQNPVPEDAIFDFLTRVIKNFDQRMVLVSDTLKELYTPEVVNWMQHQDADIELTNW